MLRYFSTLTVYKKTLIWIAETLIKRISETLSKFRRSDHAFVAVLLLGLTCTMLLAEPSMAHAAGGGSAIETGLQTLVDLLTGGAARSLAAVAVIFMGIAAMFGRMDWHKAGMVMIGIAIIFGSATIVDMFSAGL